MRAPWAEVPLFQSDKIFKKSKQKFEFLKIELWERTCHRAFTSCAEPYGTAPSSRWPWSGIGATGTTHLFLQFFHRIFFLSFRKTVQNWNEQRKSEAAARSRATWTFSDWSSSSPTVWGLSPVIQSSSLSSLTIANKNEQSWLLWNCFSPVYSRLKSEQQNRPKLEIFLLWILVAKLEVQNGFWPDWWLSQLPLITIETNWT